MRTVQTIAGIVLCLIVTLLVFDLARIAADLFGPRDSDTWLPAILVDLVFRLFREGFAGVLGGGAGITVVIKCLKRANVRVVAATVATLYIAVFLGLVGMILWNGQVPEDFLGQLAQLVGMCVGLGIGYGEGATHKSYPNMG